MGRFAALALPSVALAATALAAGAAPAEAAGEDSPPQSCVLNMDTGVYTCFDDIQAMVMARTGGTITDVTTLSQLLKPGNMARVTKASEAAADEVQAASTVVNAVLYDGANMSGASLLMEASSGCDDDAGWDWQWSSLRSDWDDRMSSGRGYSKCQVRAYEGVQFSGSMTGKWDAIYNMGVMNNATSSIRMY